MAITNTASNYDKGAQKLNLAPLLTTTPNAAKSSCQSSKTSQKSRIHDRTDLGENFIAPDGGWGWLVAFASGINILVTFALAQQFGIIFREYMQELEINSSQVTTIINTQISVSSFTGLLNGPLFRRFTYRQVAFAGSVFVVLGMFCSAFSKTFLGYVLSYSCCYGFGRGLSVSASSLAVNTFFKQKRRTATAYQFGVAGIGPIVGPYLATQLLIIYNVQGAVLLFAAMALHSIACALIYQPVQWHVREEVVEQDTLKISNVEEVIDQNVEPETPVLPRANDGWFGSVHSIQSFGSRMRLPRSELPRMEELVPINIAVHGKGLRNSPLAVDEQLKSEDQMITESNRNIKGSVNSIKSISFLDKIYIFFDLDLLQDMTYVNLAIGLTVVNLVEINFAILTPYILSDFGFSNNQIAIAMSTLGLFDLAVRFLIPMLTARIHLSNKTFFIIGVIGMCIGRFLLTFTRDFNVVLVICAWLGLNKASRTVFWALIMPGYVPLKRLPAATGLQLVCAGLFSMIFGPLIGYIRDRSDFETTLHFLNALCIFAVGMWIVEYAIHKGTLCRRNNAALK